MQTYREQQRALNALQGEASLFSRTARLLTNVLYVNKLSIKDSVSLFYITAPQFYFHQLQLPYQHSQQHLHLPILDLLNQLQHW